MPKVSVVIPVLNGERFIKDAIESVLSQSFKDLELIVVDDGSTDGTGEIVKSFGSQLVYRYQPNAGADRAYNQGISMSSGRYVASEDGQAGYLGDLMHKYGYFNVKGLTHGNQKKEDRIKWAIQGRAEKMQISLEPDDKLPDEEKWINKFLSQAVDFPNPLAHDDLLDSLAYVDQMANDVAAWGINMFEGEEWTAQDDLTGY